jgi:hypothetical protein
MPQPRHFCAACSLRHRLVDCENDAKRAYRERHRTRAQILRYGNIWDILRVRVCCTICSRWSWLAHAHKWCRHLRRMLSLEDAIEPTELSTFVLWTRFQPISFWSNLLPSMPAADDKHPFPKSLFLTRVVIRRGSWMRRSLMRPNQLIFHYISCNSEFSRIVTYFWLSLIFKLKLWNLEIRQCRTLENSRELDIWQSDEIPEIEIPGNPGNLKSGNAMDIVWASEIKSSKS